VAAQQRARVPALLAAGRLDRTVRVIARADALCPASAAESSAARATALAELGRGDEARAVASGEGTVEAASRAFEAAAGALASKRYAEAKRGFLEAWSLHRPNGPALFWAGTAAREDGAAAEAQRLFDRAMVEIARAAGEEVAVRMVDEPKHWRRHRESWLEWSSDGRWLAVGVRRAVSVRDRLLGFVETARLGDKDNLATLAAAAGGERLARHAAKWLAPVSETATISPDGKTSAEIQGDTVRLRDVATGAVKQKLKGPPDAEVAQATVAFSPDGKVLVVSSPHELRAWDAATGKPRRTVTGRGEFTVDFAFAPDSKTLAHVGDDGNTVLLLDTETWTERRRLTHPSRVRAVAFSPDGHTLATTMEARGIYAVRLWDPATSAEARASGDPTPTPPQGGARNGGEQRAERSRGSLARDVPVRFDLQGEGPRTLAFSPDGKTIASVVNDFPISTHATLSLLDVAKAPEARDIRIEDAVFKCVVVSPDGKTIASCGHDHGLRLSDAATGAEKPRLEGETKYVDAVAFSPDSRMLVSSGYGHNVLLWDLVARTVKHTLAGHTAWIPAVAFSPDGRSVASGSIDGTVRVWDVAAGTETRRLAPATAKDEAVSSVAFSPDGRSLAVRSHHRPDREGRIRLWDIATGAVTRETYVKPYEGSPVAFSADGQTLAWSAKSTLFLWDTTGDADQRRIKGHSGDVRSVAFSPAGHAFVSSTDFDVRVWSATGEPLLILRTMRAHDARFAFTTDPAPLVELLGTDPQAAAAHLVCSAGALSFPFSLCRERFEARGLIARALGGEPPGGDP
jgi:WD40 repeat protein